MRTFIALCLLIFAAAPALAESAYDRVMRTGDIRCGYIVYPPEMVRDPNTGQLSGSVYEIVEAAAERAGLTVQWVEEVPMTTMFEGLHSGRHDALCSGLYENAARARAVVFAVPVNYGVTYAFARTDDTRFDDDLATIDDSSITIAVIDGEIGQAIASARFPRARTLALPQLSDNSMVLESVATKKADVAFLQKANAAPFLANNPGKVKVAGPGPVRTYPAPPMAFAPGELRLKFLMDAALREVLLDGTVERIVHSYDPEEQSYLLPARPYQQ
ncbi:MAG: transporter substrate-binding domain-containing protein [Alphaproteobacteria bacterium]|jgi:ABC-type amino acid transport substrate-binding protein|nr:transporter substrate-binding domain-containing protein [Alphaproteobacteria bacterium]